jgi:hypothetical protein
MASLISVIIMVSVVLRYSRNKPFNTTKVFSLKTRAEEFCSPDVVHLPG